MAKVAAVLLLLFPQHVDVLIVAGGIRGQPGVVVVVDLLPVPMSRPPPPREQRGGLEQDQQEAQEEQPPWRHGWPQAGRRRRGRKRPSQLWMRFYVSARKKSDKKFYVRDNSALTAESHNNGRNKEGEWKDWRFILLMIKTSEVEQRKKGQ